MAYGLSLRIVMVTVTDVHVFVARRSFAGRQSLDYSLAFSREVSCAHNAPPVNEFYSRGITDASIRAQKSQIRRSTAFICSYMHLCCFQRAQQSSA
jgi:hypothetical protein